MDLLITLNDKVVYMKKHRVILIGCGEHALENLIPSLNAIASVEIKTVCDNLQENIEKAKSWCPLAKFIIKEKYTIKDLKGHTAVIVAGPPQLHEEISRISIENGIPVFVEKPPTVNTETLQYLADLATKKNVVTCVGHNLRHSTSALELQNAIRDEDFGVPVAMEMRYMASKPRGTRWGLSSPLRSFLLSHANHAIDLMIYQMGKIKNTVAARVWPDINGGVAITVQFIFESGAVGNLLASSYAPYFQVNLSVLSNKGVLAEMNGLREINMTGSSDLRKRWHKQWKPRTLETGYSFAGYQTELESFFRAIEYPLEKTNIVHPSFHDEVEIYKAIDAIEKCVSDNN
ncbi:MAG: Gfo/Idh/MocA family oxidoreductase [Bacteroidetes bacterium]|nr:Gfo/Idh/MocA family oxidoreductase [Bacteroidota bacterium]